MDKEIRELRELKKRILDEIERCTIISIKAEYADKLVEIERKIELEKTKNMKIIQDILYSVY